MDGGTFDQLTRSLKSRAMRRSSLILGLAALTMAGSPDRQAEAGGKKKPKPKKKKKKKMCGKGERLCAATNTCVAGVGGCCSDTECSVCEAKFCVQGTCQCYGNTILHNGVCGLFTQCKSTGERSTDFHGLDCCSDNSEADGNGNSFCVPGTGVCLADADCKSGPCRGFMCPELYNVVTRC